MLSIKQFTRGRSAEFIQTAHEQLPFAASHAMNKSLGYAKGMLRSEMDQYIAGGATQFTKNGMKIQYSKKRHLRGEIYFQQNRGYIRQIMEGGPKFATGSRLPEPVRDGKKLRPPHTKYGNIRRGFQQTYQKGGKHPKYFVGVPKNWKVDKNPNYYGLWQRYKDGKEGKLKLIISYRRAMRSQRITFPAKELAAYHYQRKLIEQWPLSFKYAMDSAR